MIVISGPRAIFIVCLALILAAVPSLASPGGSVDTLSAERLASIDSLEAKLSRNKLGSLLSDFVFAKRPLDDGDVTRPEKSEEDFIEYRGKFIRKISVLRLNIFGEAVVGTPSPEDPALVRLINRTHIDTREGKIEDFFLMHEGEPLDPFRLADTERLIRNTQYIQDARIEVIPAESSPDSVDLVLLTRDVWSLGINVSVIDLQRYRAKVYERNLLGLGHGLEYEADMDFSDSRQVDHTALYRVSNIEGSFIDGEVKFVDAHHLKWNRWNISRGYVSPEIRYIGALTIEGKESFEEGTEPETRQYDRVDIWIGRTFPLGTRPASDSGRRRLIPAVRVTRTDHHLRPYADADTNRTYHDRTATLASLTLTELSYRTDRLILSYGRTEDVPYGFLAVATGGIESGEFLKRPYTGISLSYGNYTGKGGYLLTRAGIGAYIRNDRAEDGTLSLVFAGFHRLVPLGGGLLRTITYADYILGLNQLPTSQVRLEGNRGQITGLSGTNIRGKQRLVLRLESIYFTPWNWYGFRLALLGWAETGQVGPDWNSFLEEKYYSSLGTGIRVHNERLIFSAYELSFIWIPTAPEGAETDWFRFSAVRSFDIPLLTPGAPRIERYE
jgi:hypothetical protein